MFWKKRKGYLECFFCFSIFFMVLISWMRMFHVEKDSSFSAQGIGSLKYFTVLSNLFVGITSFILGFLRLRCLFMNREVAIPSWIYVIHFCATVSVSITGAVVLFILSPMLAYIGKGYFSMLQKENFVLHCFSPVSSVVLFLFFLPDYRMRFNHVFLPFIPFTFYVFFYLLNFRFHYVSAVLVTGEEGYDWYSFLSFGYPYCLCWLFPASYLFVFSLSFLLYFFRKRREKAPSRS